MRRWFSPVSTRRNAHAHQALQRKTFRGGVDLRAALSTQFGFECFGLVREIYGAPLSERAQIGIDTPAF